MDIIHEITCRTCLVNVGADYLYQIINGNENEYKLKTDYEVVTKLTISLKANNFRCPVCGSLNLQVSDIKINDYPLYDFDRIADRGKTTDEQMLILSYTKKDNEISYKIGGKMRKIKAAFLAFCILNIIKVIKEIDEQEFVRHSKGNFHFCYTGFYDDKTCDVNLRLEQLYYFGFSKAEILTELDKRRIEFLKLI